MAYLLYWLGIPFEVCKGLNKCLSSKVHIVLSSKSYENVSVMSNVDKTFDDCVFVTKWCVRCTVSLW